MKIINLLPFLPEHPFASQLPPIARVRIDGNYLHDADAVPIKPGDKYWPDFKTFNNIPYSAHKRAFGNIDDYLGDPGKPPFTDIKFCATAWRVSYDRANRQPFY